VSELLHGVHRARGAERVRRLGAVEHVLAAVPAIPITEVVARLHAEVHAGLTARGVVVGAHDLWIAATALTHGLGLATRNARDFERVPGLRVLGV
jgi:tRNA(fMet)-specific endonuclease VapC